MRELPARHVFDRDGPASGYAACNLGAKAPGAIRVSRCKRDAIAHGKSAALKKASPVFKSQVAKLSR